MSDNDYNFILNNDRIPTYDNPTTNDDWPTIRELFPQWNAQNIQSFAQVKNVQRASDWLWTGQSPVTF